MTPQASDRNMWKYSPKFQINDRTDVIEAAREWLDSQDDVIDCPLGARMTKRSCRRRQTIRTTHDGHDHIRPMFLQCAGIGCNRFRRNHRRLKPTLTQSGIIMR